MQEQRIAFDTAKLAKDKGFDEYCSRNFDVNGKPSSFTGYAVMHKYNKNSTIHLYDTDTEEFEYPDLLCTRPTQTLLQNWLREVHNFDIFVQPILDEQNIKTYVACYGVITDIGMVHSPKEFSSYEEALEVGLLEGLKQIIQQ